MTTPAKATEVKAENVKADAKPVEANAEAAKSETVELTDEQRKQLMDALPEEMRDAITKLNSQIAEHNEKVNAVKSAESKDPKLIKAEIFEQNPNNNKKLAALYAEYDKAIAAAEKLRAQAYEVIEKDGLMPKELTEDELTKAKEDITSSTKSLRDSVFAFEHFEKMMPGLKILPLITEIKTRGRGGKPGAKTGQSEGIKRPRFKRIEINGQIEDDKGNKVYAIGTNGEKKFTFTLAAKYLSKQHKGLTVGSNDLMDAMIKSGVDPENIPDSYTFEYPFTYKSADGNDTTIKYVIKTTR